MVGDRTVHLGTSAPVLSVREIYLEVTDGPDRGQRFGPLEPVIRVGSAEGNEVRLSDTAVSRFHFTIERGPKGLLIVDTDSTNGTFVGSCRVHTAFVEAGTEIRAGQSTLVLSTSKTPKIVELSSSARFGDLLGESAAMRSLFSLLERLAPAHTPVLIEGETGTGKELVARALHQNGPRAQRPFVVVDCGASATTLIESELFGHEKGAFTGAELPRAGAFELAEGGTLFLDEIGELPLEVQPKLLRALEAKTIRRLGAQQERNIDVRVLSATHRNLRRMVNEGTFREDLYFRLAVFPVRVPPLRSRPEDLPALCGLFLEQTLRATGETRAPALLSADTLAYLRSRSFPGNVRELRNLVERAVILGDPDEIASGDLSEALRSTTQLDREPERDRQTLEEAKRRFEREYLIRLVLEHKGDFKAAAEAAGIHMKSLQRLVRRHGLKDELTETD